MAKTYINTVKYQIITNFKIDGIVDKHDIIGAVFGQSEGLVGEELDLKELQKAGKIGRIEVEAKIKSGKTTGTLTVPSSMDMVQTSLLAAAIESVDKVGPCTSEFKTEKIEDMRASKRKTITERAREILQGMVESMPETQELTQEIRLERRTADLTEMGREKLPAGPEAETSNEIIIVEGRADVLTLLKYGIKNVLGIDGSKIPESLPQVCDGKKVTLFVDGDRGGQLILKNAARVIKIDSVAFAPDGKEVEELTQKEILSSLRKKTDFGTAMSRERSTPSRLFAPIKTFERTENLGSDSEPVAPKRFAPIKTFERTERVPRTFQKTGYGTRTRKRSTMGYRSTREYAPRYALSHYGEERRHTVEPTVDPKEIAPYSETMKEIADTLKARLLDKELKTIKEIGVRDLLSEITNTPNTHAVVFDGIVTKRLVDTAEKNNVEVIVGVKKGKIEENQKVKVITLN